MWIRNNFQFQGHECQGLGLKAHNPTVGNEKKSRKNGLKCPQEMLTLFRENVSYQIIVFFLKIQERPHCI